MSDEEWAFVAPYLVLLREGAPQRKHDLRDIFNAVRWIVRAGAPWRDMPERYGSCKTAHDRFRRWQRNGTWDNVLATLRLKADQRGLLDYSQYNADSTSIRATRAAGGAKKKPARRRWE